MVALEASKLFCQLSPKELSALRPTAREQAFPAGREIFKESDPGDGLYIVKDGLVEISVLIGQNLRRVFSRIAPGDIFGEMAVIDDKPRSASAVAARDTVVYFVSRAEMLKLIERSPTLTLGLLREVSHRLREFDRQYLREVLQAERLAVVGRFARSIVHDLKNPLNIIGLTAEMAAMDSATPEIRRRAEAGIRTQVERISEMIGEILDFTQGAHLDFVLAPIDYGTFIEQLVEELRPEAALKSVTLKLESPPPAVRLLINPKRLRRVFFNLIHNAAEAMPDGGKVSLRFRSSATEIVTEIEDDGPGIAPEIADQLFEAFATHGKPHGTGLGLTISKRIIEDHRGWITARSEPGKGAAFSFGLPRQDHAAA
jgi:signal transduction histidine kinase